MDTRMHSEDTSLDTYHAMTVIIIYVLINDIYAIALITT